MPAKTLDDLPEDCFIIIKNFQASFGDGYNIDYVNRNGIRYLFGLEKKPLGMMTISVDSTNITGKIYTVDFAKAQKGYGPLLYNIAMEFVAKITNGKGYLKSDPGGVSQDAERIWNHFDRNDSTVNKKQLDSLQNELTPTKIDNVDQTFVQKQYTKKWFTSPLSRGFSKKSTNLLDHPKVLNKVIQEKTIKNIRIKNVRK